MAEDTVPLRSSLSITTDDDDQFVGETETIPLRTRILQVVKSSPNLTIRPSRVSQELGLSITDASAELCGLLKVVGEGSTFHFETIDGVHTMVFSFPSDFEAKALAAERNDDWKTLLLKAAQVAIKVLKLLTAFGLILSTMIVSIAGMVALVAAIVAMSRGGGDNRARHHLSRQLHHIFITVRQLLWCYAMFGPDDSGQDPFFREAAYDTSLVLSMCCGNPSSLWFWMRAGHLRRRRHRMARGWGITQNNDFTHTSSSELEGVHLIRRGSWGQEEVLPVPSSASVEPHRGLLSVAVEFLFGSTTPSGPSEADKWRLRSAVIVEKSTAISLEELSPYADVPPASLKDGARVVSEGLLVVAHFNGIPSKTEESTENLFIFPELISESTMATRYEDPSSDTGTEDDSRWAGLFYVNESSSTSSTNPRSGNRSMTTTPNCLYEQHKNFTKLTSKQFYHCLLVAVLNFIGVVWFAQSLEPGGILEQNIGSVGPALKWGIIPVLWFYARLFFFIPGVRLAYIFGWNEFCQRRNQRRGQLAVALKEVCTAA
jgi:hypothetical protein